MPGRIPRAVEDLGDRLKPAHTAASDIQAGEIERTQFAQLHRHRGVDEHDRLIEGITGIADEFQLFVGKLQHVLFGVVGGGEQDILPLARFPADDDDAGIVILCKRSDLVCAEQADGGFVDGARGGGAAIGTARADGVKVDHRLIDGIARRLEGALQRHGQRARVDGAGADAAEHELVHGAACTQQRDRRTFGKRQRVAAVLQQHRRFCLQIAGKRFLRGAEFARRRIFALIILQFFRVDLSDLFGRPRFLIQINGDQAGKGERQPVADDEYGHQDAQDHIQ